MRRYSTHSLQVSFHYLTLYLGLSRPNVDFATSKVGGVRVTKTGLSSTNVECIDTL